MRWLVLCLVIASCARAGKENSIIGGLVDAGPRDATVVPPPDASPIDAPAGQITLTQTASAAIALGTSFNCHRSPSGFTRENSYYRVFTLSDYSITSTLHVTQVDFAIDDAVAGTGGQQPASIHIGTYGGTPDAPTLDATLIREISSVDIQIRDGTGSRMTVPITADVAATTSMIVELLIPDGLAAGNMFTIGVNGEGERKPGYTRGPACGIIDPTTMQSISADHMLPTADIVMTVTGQTLAAAN